MIEHHLDTKAAILHIQPRSSLEKADFESLAKTVDPFLADTGELAGLIVEVASFPGWESLGALLAHVRFVRDHHRHIAKVAFVTDSALGSIAENLASHFVSAEIKRFPLIAEDTNRILQSMVERLAPVKEIASFGGKVGHYVTPAVEMRLRGKFAK